MTIGADSPSVPNFNFSLSEAIILLEEHRSRDAVFDPATEGALISAYVVLMVTGILSNFLMASVICSRKHLYRNKHGLRGSARRGSHFFLLNLNASDLALCMVAMPFTLLQLVRRHWGLGDAFCKGVALIQGASVFVSSSTISAIAVQRQRAIVRLGQRAPNGVCCCFDSANGGGRYPVACAMSIWLLSLVLAAPASMARTLAFAEVAGVHVYTRCVERWPSPVIQLAYAMATFVFQLVTPTALLASTHIRVRGQLRYTLNGNTGSSESSCPTHSSVCAERLRRELDRNRRATVVLLYVTAAFALTWLPWNIVNLIVDVSPSLLSPKNMYLSFAICHLIAMTSATINPVLYGWLNTNLRRQVRSLKKHVLRNLRTVRPEDIPEEGQIEEEEDVQVVPCATTTIPTATRKSVL